MRIWPRLFDRMMGQRAGQEKDFERELRTHLDLEVEEQQNAGMLFAKGGRS